MVDSVFLLNVLVSSATPLGFSIQAWIIYLCVTILSRLVPNLGFSEAIGYTNLMLYLVSLSPDGVTIRLISLET